MIEILFLITDLQNKINGTVCSVLTHANIDKHNQPLKIVAFKGVTLVATATILQKESRAIKEQKIFNKKPAFHFDGFPYMANFSDEYDQFEVLWGYGVEGQMCRCNNSQLDKI